MNIVQTIVMTINGVFKEGKYTLNILFIRTDISEETVETQTRLLIRRFKCQLNII